MEIVLFVILIVSIVLNIRLAWDSVYGCPTRAAFDLIWPILQALGYKVVYFDLDHFGRINDTHTKEGANRLVQKSIRSYTIGRPMDIALFFRYFSGDEFVVLVWGDKSACYKVAERVQKSFKANSLSCTVIIGDDPMQCDKRLGQAKPKSGPRPEEGAIITI